MATIIGTNAKNKLVGSALTDSLFGLGGNDIVQGMSGDDKLDGGSGNDLLDGGKGGDTMKGGQGNDTYIVDNARDKVIEGVLAGTDLVRSSIMYVLSANVESLTLTGTKSIGGAGNALDNLITGNTGNNSLDGGIGADTLIGGAGDDTYIVNDNHDSIVERIGAGTDTVRTSLAAFVLDANIESLTYTGAQDFLGTGNALANRIAGGGGGDNLDGGLGADTLIGGAGNDFYHVDNINDVVTEGLGAGNDTVVTTLSAYTLQANIERLSFGGNGDFSGTGNALDNTLFAGNGHDTLAGGAGIDAVDYSSAVAGVWVDLANNTSFNQNFPQFSGAQGDSWTSIESVVGSSFGDVLSCNSGGTAYGGDGPDSISGVVDVGSEVTLIGGLGGDSLSWAGGGGRINFMLELGAAMNSTGDTINEFVRTGSPDDYKLLVGAADFGGLKSVVLSNHAADHISTGLAAQFVYQQDSHQLWFDSDGADGNAPVMIAEFNPFGPDFGNALQISDFILI